jgi:hypothetical protein
MTRLLKGHFDGRVIVLDTPADLPRDQRLIIHVEPEQDATTEDHSAGSILKNIQPISDEAAAEMKRAIQEECERIEPDPEINFE